MTVSQLITELQKLPQDKPVATLWDGDAIDGAKVFVNEEGQVVIAGNLNGYAANETVINQQEELFKLLPIGRAFSLLGRSIIIVSHIKSRMGFSIIAPPAPTPPAVIGEYADNNGVIRTYNFGVKHIELIRKYAVNKP